MDSRIKIIPLLVMVAIMAFSVRLIDFSLGVSSLSGSAMAEAAPERPKPPPMDQAQDITGALFGLGEKDEDKDGEDDHGEMTDDKADKAMDNDKAAMKKDAAPAMAPKESKWRDAKDETMGGDNVRRDVMGDIAKRRKMLDEKESSMVTREALLRASSQELEQKYKELLQLRTEIEGLLNKQSEEERLRIESLVKIYEGMKPKDAARIFDTLDLDVLVMVLSRMSERKLSPILAAMNPERRILVRVLFI
jgi:flagellar motility protein MotE (MotC chaperone)